MISYGLLLPFAFIGGIILLIKPKKYILFLSLPLFFHTFAHMAVGSTLRYRVPADSFLIILGAYGINALYRFLTTIMRKRLWCMGDETKARL